MIRLAPAFFVLLLAGCGAKEDPTANAAPPPGPNAVAPPATPNAKQGGPQDMAPGSSVMKPGTPVNPGP